MAEVSEGRREGGWAGATHDANGDCGEGERVANNAAETEARRPLAVASVFHFCERGGCGCVGRGHILLVVVAMDGGE